MDAESGTASPSMRELALTAEQRAIGKREIVEESGADAHAMAGPLARIGRPEEMLGALSIGRTGEPFDDAQYEGFEIEREIHAIRRYPGGRSLFYS